MSEGIPAARSIAALRHTVAGWRAAGESVGLVPTMGALHRGHLALVAEAQAQCRRTVVSIFVNPTQFGPSEDFGSYPRPEAADLAALTAAGADLAFLPAVAEMYPEGAATTVSVAGVSEGLCGAHRPGHFDGVATIVAKLLIQAMPDRAYFGEKDYQQLMVVRRMAHDLDLPVDIVGVPTVREPDGLALSSRNVYLTAEQRATAPLLYREMQRAAAAIATRQPAEPALRQAITTLTGAGFGVEYFELRDALTLRPVDVSFPGRFRLLAAVHLGRTRLIDNIPVAPS